MKLPTGLLQTAYRRLPEKMRTAIPLDTRLWLRDHISPIVFGTTAPRIRTIEGQLWGGFSQRALAEIETILAGAPPLSRLAASASRARARWYGARGDAAAALADLHRASKLWPAFGNGSEQAVLEAWLLGLLGEGPAARARLGNATARRPFETAAMLAWANSWNPILVGDEGSETAVLAAVNAVFARFGLTGITQRDPARPLSLDNLAAVAPIATAACDARVSVIVPLHNAGSTLSATLDSLASQSWTDLEVIVVDDASTDNSAAIVADTCARDPRFRLIRQTENLGSYVARNRGLEAATGAFVTTHDADDWSHPDKIRLQMEALRAADAPFSLSGVIRTGAGLDFRGPLRLTARPVTRNFSSLLAPRDLLNRMGGWDRVRIAADSEMIHRLEYLHGLKGVSAVLSDCPLSFARIGAASLTGGGATHLATLYHGIRREYHETRRLWHTSLEQTAVLAHGLSTPPPEADIPPTICAAPRERAPVDLLVVADFNRGDHRPLLATARARNMRVALLHYPDATGDVTRPLDGELRRFTQTASIATIAPGERLTTATVLVVDPEVFGDVMDDPPVVEYCHLLIALERPLANPAAILSGLQAIFGESGKWLAGSENTAAAMAADPRLPAPADAPPQSSGPESLLARIAALTVAPR